MSRLSAGVYGTCAGESSLVDSGLNEAQAISLFPRAHPHSVTAITRGVKVGGSLTREGRGEGGAESVSLVISLVYARPHMSK